jgi:hypothetical protein
MGYFGVHQGTGIGLLMLRSRLQEKMGTKKRSHLIKNAIAFYYFILGIMALKFFLQTLSF